MYKNVAVWLAAIVLAIAVAAAFVAESESAARAREDAIVQLTSLARQVALRLDRGMFERYREFELISSRPTLGDPAVPLAEKQRLLDELKQSHSAYTWIGATDVSGTVVAAADGLLAGADVSQRPWFTNAFRDVHVGDVHDAKLLASKVPNDTGEPMRFVDVAFPYRDPAGNVAGILGAHINWRWADREQQAILSRQGAAPGVETFVVANDGTVILGPRDAVGEKLMVRDNPGRADGPGAVSVERWPDRGGAFLAGYGRTHGFQSYPGLGWSVVVRQPAQEVLAPAKALRNQVLWTGAAVALLLLVFGIAMPRRLARA